MSQLATSRFHASRNPAGTFDRFNASSVGGVCFRDREWAAIPSVSTDFLREVQEDSQLSEFPKGIRPKGLHYV